MQDDPYYLFWRKHWIVAVCTAAVCISLLTGWLWCNRIQTNPERAFWSAVNQSLGSSSVTVDSSQSGNGNEVSQSVGLSLGAENKAHAFITLKQAGSKVKTEVIGTPEADYTRYTTLQAGVGNKATLDTRRLVDVWGKSSPQLFNQSALGVGLSLGNVPVPIANVHGTAQAKLLKEIKDHNLYRLDLARVKKEHKDGRLLYMYHVTSLPFVYVEVLQLVAKQIGVSSLQKVDPADYRSLAAIKMEITVDVRARHVVAVRYDDSTYNQSYHSYDVPIDGVVPAKTIPMTDLQKRLQVGG